MVPDPKDIRFSEKRVDESYKEQAARERDVKGAPQNSSKARDNSSSENRPQTSKLFINLVTSLGMQALMNLGEIPNPGTQEREVNLEAAKEIIDLLIDLKKKTEDNLSGEENKLLESLLPELQLKFAQVA